jgi:O-antigen/teichoic acid export membrane protein
MSEDREYKRRLPAGLFDSGFASLATFAAGLSAVTLLGDADRGVYAVFFTAFMLGTVLPRNLIFTPAEVRAVAFPVKERLSLLPRSLALGLGPALLGASAVLMAVAATWTYTTTEVLIALTLTTGVTTILSPLQDHVRKMLHIATLSWRAASVSMVQFTAVAVAVGVMLLLDVGAAWIPFGALAIANAVSLAFSRSVVHLPKGFVAPVRLHFRSLASKGKWLVVQASATATAGFAVAAIISWLAGPDALGFAESARVVAQPILVLASGFTAVLAPRSMKAGMDRNLTMARQTSRVYYWIVGLAGLGYLAIAGWDWILNPMAYIVPSAYVVPGLVALSVVANMAIAAVFLQINELLGAHEEKALARISWMISPIYLLGGLTAGFTGAYARPLGMLGQTSARYVTQERKLHSVYSEQPETTHEMESSEASAGLDGE